MCLGLWQYNLWAGRGNVRWLPQGRAFPAGKSELLAEKGFRHFLAPGPFNTAQPVSLHFAHLILTDASSVPLPHFGQIPPLPLLPVLNKGLQPIPWRWFPTWNFRYDTKEQGFPLCVPRAVPSRPGGSS